MPIFEYKCDDCQKKFEELVSSGQEVSCPSCQSVKITKLLSSFAAGAGSSSSSAASGCAAPSGGCGSGFS